MLDHGSRGGAAERLRHASGAARRPADARARAAQCSVFIAFDPALREGAGGEPARARNSDIMEDLGLVEYVFSDKTGTLTSNEMQLRAVAVKDAAFGGLDTKCGPLAPRLQPVPSSRPEARSEARASAARGLGLVAPSGLRGECNFQVSKRFCKLSKWAANMTRGAAPGMHVLAYAEQVSQAASAAGNCEF